MRLRRKLLGTSKKPRVSVFRSNRFLYAQVIDDLKNETIVSQSDVKLNAKGKTKTEVAETVGKKLGEKLQKKKINKVVFDRSGYKFHGRVKSLAQGMREAGIKF